MPSRERNEARNAGRRAGGRVGGATRPKCEHGTPGSGPQFGHGTRLLEACASAACSRPRCAGIAGNILPCDARLRFFSGSCTRACAISAENWPELLRVVCGYGVLLLPYNKRALRVYYMQVLDRERHRWLRCLGRTGASRRDSEILEAQLGGPDPDSAQGWAVVHDRHKRHSNMGPASQT